MPEPPIFLVTGPPGAGKTVFTSALLQRFERAVHMHVDDMRMWVVRGLCDSFGWGEETERQFKIAEEATMDVALRYQAGGFAVAVDHCRNMPRMEALAQARLAGVPVVKVCLLPDLETNLARNHARQDKPYDPHMLDPIILEMNPSMRTNAPDGWIVVDNTGLTVEETVDRVWPSRD